MVSIDTTLLSDIADSRTTKVAKKAGRLFNSDTQGVNNRKKGVFKQ